MASTLIGLISFVFTLATFLNVFWSSVQTIHAAPQPDNRLPLHPEARPTRRVPPSEKSKEETEEREKRKEWLGSWELRCEEKTEQRSSLWSWSWRH
jgi:hypothetical protein